jgi:uncharacterized membrane protein YbhN (UPF0104 family)
LVVLAGAVVLLAAVFKSDALARRVGNGIGRVISAVRRVFRKPPVTGLDERASKFRSDTIDLVSRRWIRLTWTTLLSQMALFLILLLSLRHLGVSEQEVSTAEAFAVFSFGRLISALPITPGGLGVIELGYIGGTPPGTPGGGAGPGRHKAAVVAAVLLFRTLTFGIQIPLGGFTYLIWRAKKSWRRVPEEDELQASAVVSG